MTDRTPRDATIKSWRRFRHDNRALSTQLDFLFAMILYGGAAVLFLGVAAGLIYSAAGVDQTNRVVADRAADRLSDDLLVDVPNEAILNRTCTKAFFDKSASSGCGFVSSWSNTDQPEHYLNRALAVDNAKQINVTIRTTGGSIESIDGTRLALGESPPTDRSTVHGFHRQVGLDVNNDGAADWYRIEVKVW